MSGSGGSSGINIPITAEDLLTPEIERIVQTAIAASRKIAQETQAGSLLTGRPAATVQEQYGAQLENAGIDEEQLTAPLRHMAVSIGSIFETLERQLTQSVSRLALLSRPGEEGDRAREVYLKGTSATANVRRAESELRASSPEVIAAQAAAIAAEKVTKNKVGAAASEEYINTGGVASGASKAVQDKLAAAQTKYQAALEGSSLDQSAVAEILAATKKQLSEGLTLNEQILAYQKRAAMLWAESDATLQAKTGVSEEEASMLHRYGVNIRSTATPMAARRGARHNLGTLTSDLYAGFRGGGRELSGPGMHGEETGMGGLGGAYSAVGGAEGVGGLSAAAFGGYAFFMVGMTVVNDLARGLMSMEQEARKLQDALAPVTQTFVTLGLVGASLHTATSAATSSAMSASLASGIAPSALLPVFGYAAAQYGLGGADAAVQATSKYSVVSGEEPTQAYTQLRSIGVPFGTNNLSQVSDQIVATAEKFGVSLQDIESGLQQVAVAASDSGMSLKQTSTVIGKAAQDTGQSSATEGAAFARVLTVLQSNLGVLSTLGQQFPSLGRQLTPQILASGNPGQLLGAIGRANLSPTEQLLLAQSLGIGRQDVASLGIFNSVTQTQNGTVGGPGNAAGATTRLFNQELATFDNQMKLLWNTVKDVGAAIVSGLLPGLTDAIKLINSFIGNGSSQGSGPLPWIQRNVGQTVHDLVSPPQPPSGSGFANNNGFYTNYDGDPQDPSGSLVGYAQGGQKGLKNLGTGLIPIVDGKGKVIGNVDQNLNFIPLQNALNAHGGVGSKPYGPSAPETQPGGLPLTLNGILGIDTTGRSATTPIGASVQTLQSLYSSGFFGTGASATQGYVGALGQQASTDTKVLNSPGLTANSLQQFAQLLQQVKDAMAQAYSQRASEMTAYGSLIAATEAGNNIQAALNIQIQANSQAVQTLKQAYDAEPNAQNLQALQQAQTQVASQQNQLAAAKAQAAQGQLTATGAITQASLSGRPVAQGQAQVSNLGQQITQLEQQAASNAIDPEQAKAQIGQLMAQAIQAQYQLAQTQFTQSQAGLVAQQGQAQARGKLVQVAQKQLTLDQQTLGFMQQHSPGDLLAIAQQTSTVLQDKVSVAVQQAAVQSGIASVTAAQQRAHGQLVASDETSLNSLKKTLQLLLVAGVDPTSTQITTLDAQIAQATQTSAQDFVTTTENHLQAMTDIHQITIGQQLSALRLLENSPQAQSLGQPVLDQIKQAMQSIYNQLSNNLQFDLPSNINIAGLYYSAKRGVGAGGTGAYNDNRVITINLEANNSSQMAQVQQVINDTLGQSNRVYSTNVRRY